ncbi:putative serine protease K12H4.7 isoform X2 [Bradysia coprophila]|uniref:putative serine protease K12H4.7 isoform X2 n=1 Tax=Bradysia coprophila TaxID=38358 RepID=UPI00187DD6EA|nr:putative serine protease K12H4.7 isoform X2 [Bradysia coprophila]
MMKIVIIAAIVATALAAPLQKQRVSIYDLLGRRDPFPEPKYPSPIPQNVTLLTIEQRVDNFNPASQDTWLQRYLINDEFYTPGSPIFLFLGGEWTITPYRMTFSLMHDMADDLNASILYLEHRYYGESRPTPNVTDENLRFLTPQQALADTAHFVSHIQATIPGASRSPFILVGGHYSASLAVWFRQAYPHLALGVWASSAPLPSVVDFDQFKVATGAAFRNVGGDSCYDAMDLGFDRVQEMVDADQWDELTEAFYLCDPLEPEDLPHLFSIVAEIYAIQPQFSDEYTMEQTCATIEEAGSTVESIAHVILAFIDPAAGQCFNIDYDDIIENERRTEWDAPAVLSGYRQWTYQLCSQIGWFHTSTSPDQPFGDNFGVDLYHAGCQAVFGERFTEERLENNSDRFNTLFGGLNPDVTNAVFVYGQHDPWSVIGRRTDLNGDAVAIVIEGATMGKDLGPATYVDSDAVAEAKEQIEEIIRGWLSEAANV